MKHRLIILAIAATIMVACKSAPTKEGVLGQLETLPEYCAMYYAPIHIGRQVLTGENHDNPQAYIDQRFGELISNGLLSIEIKEKNAWRTVIHISLTDKATNLLDPRRTDKEHAFVAVCRFHPVVIDTLLPLGEDSLTCKYIIEQQEITPFGKSLGFQQGKQHKTVINIKK